MMAKGETMVRIKKDPEAVRGAEISDLPQPPKIGADDAATLISVAVVKELEAQLRKGARVSPGAYEVRGRMQLDVEATFSMLPDEDYRPTVSIPLKTTLALIVQRMGWPRDKTLELLAQCMTDAISANKDAAPYISERIAEVEIAMARVEALANQLPKKTRKGRLTCKHRKVQITGLLGSVDVEE